MAKYIAFLRGINVGGKNIIKMESLKKSFESAGYKNVKTFIQSGNVLFETKSVSENSITKKIELLLKKDFNSDIKVMLRTVTELQNLAIQNPFKNKTENSERKLYVCFLYEKPPAGKKLPSVSKTEGAEVTGINEREVFIICYRTKNGRYGFPNNFTEKELGVYSTARNWNTVCKISASV